MFSLFKKEIIDEPFDEQFKELQESLAKTGSDLELQEDCDSLSNSFGDFGHIHTNPIPANGVLGEFKYLHRLLCKCNRPLYFHRIGNRKVDWIKGGIDIYETVCYEGLHWDILFFHMHHPRRSKLIPKKYSFSKFHPEFSRIPVVIGTNLYVKSFPFGLSPGVKRFFGPSFEIFINRILTDYEKSLKNNPQRFERPQMHNIKLKESLVNIAARSTLG